MFSQEAVQAEINYRLERAHAAALASEALEARRQHPSRLRRRLTRSTPRESRVQTHRVAVSCSSPFVHETAVRYV